MTIQWNDNYDIGNQQIDDQHRELFKIANRFLTAESAAEQLSCAQSLVDYTQHHFAYEESLMRSFNFPDYEPHVNSHRALVVRLAGLQEAILQGSLDKERLQEFIKHWALFHIPTVDARLAEYISGSETQQAKLD